MRTCNANMISKLFLFYVFSALVCFSLARSHGLQRKVKKSFVHESFNLASPSALKRVHSNQQNVHSFGIATSTPSNETGKIVNIFQQPLLYRKNVIENRKRHPRRRRYALHGSKMKKMDIKWTIAVYSKKMSHSKQRTVFEKAFQTWAAQCRLSFMYTTDTSKADIIIKFVTGEHGDQDNFGEFDDLIGHAKYPISGSGIHLYEEENWVADESGKGGISLLSAALPLIGASLGLRKSSVRNAVMFKGPLQNGRNTLSVDDINGICAVYGKCTIQKVDAIVTGTPGYQDKALVYKNEWFWDVKLATGKTHQGYPKKHAEYFNTVLRNKAPFKTVFYEPDYNTYVFMYSSGYTVLDDSLQFPAQSKYMRYADRQSYFPFLKSAPDAAIVDPNNKAIYHFFQGSKYYMYDSNTYELMPGYPKAISSTWPGVPNDLDTAFYNFEKKAYYFIKRNEFYILDSATGKYYPGGTLNHIFQNICPV